jgi:hypothetical protein
MEDLAPVVAPALGRLVRSPGAKPNWVAPLFRRLERDAPGTWDRFRRLYGLSRKIASLANLTPQDAALLGPAALFTALLDEPAPPAIGSGAWARYLRERAWAHYALQTARAAHEVLDSDSRAAAALTAATVIDNEAVIRSANILRALRELRARATTPELSRIVELLWTERGQSICDLHARHGSRTYVIDPNEFAAGIALLEGARKPAERESRREAHSAPEPPSRTSHREEARKAAGPAPATSDAFERRKRAVAETHSLREAFGIAPAERPEATQPATAPPAPVEVSGAGGDRQEDLPGPEPVPDEKEQTDAAGSTPGAAPAQTIEEPPMNDTTPTTASPAELDARLTATVEELRQRFAEIERLAVEGQHMLARLAPTIEGFAAMVAEFESVLSRWRGGRSEAA